MQNETAYVFQTNTTLPQILQLHNPTLRLTEGVALLEKILGALNADPQEIRRRFKIDPGKLITVETLVRHHQELLQPVQDVLFAIKIRNGHLHRTPPKIADVAKAADRILIAIEKVLPHTTRSVQRAVNAILHEPIECLTTAQAMDLPGALARLTALSVRLGSLLCECDLREVQPPYSLLPGQSCPTVCERFDRHQAKLTGMAKLELTSALRYVERNAGKPLTPAKEHHEKKHLTRHQQTLLKAIAELEMHLGIIGPEAPKPAEPVLPPMDCVADSPSQAEVEPAIEAPVEPETTSPETTPIEALSCPPPAAVTAIVHVPKVAAPQKPAGPGCFRVRLRIPRSAVRNVFRTGFAAASLFVAAAGLQMGGVTLDAKTAAISGDVLAGGSLPADVAFWTRPEWTSEALAAHVNAEVLLRVRTNPAGEVISIRILHDPGYGLGAKAIEAVRDWRFSGGARKLVVSVPFRPVEE